MPFEVKEYDSSQFLHEENKFHRGQIVGIHEEDGKFGKQLKWVIVLDEDKDAYTDEEGQSQDRETWAYCGATLTTHDKNKFRRWVKGLLGRNPEPGEIIDETKFIGQRVGVMFEHYTAKDGETKDKVIMIVSEDSLG